MVLGFRSGPAEGGQAVEEWADMGQGSDVL